MSSSCRSTDFRRSGLKAAGKLAYTAPDGKQVTFAIVAD
jgi:hypothetical protein